MNGMILVAAGRPRRNLGLPWRLTPDDFEVRTSLTPLAFARSSAAQAVVLNQP
jgi:hypothetical protein